ncbi:hypothetical protein [Ferruginibacter sp.]
MRRYILISILALLSFTAAQAQDRDTLTYIDTSLYYRQLAVSPDSVAAWKNMRGFEYVKYLDSALMAEKKKQKKETKQEEYTAPSGPSWIDRFLSSGGLQGTLWVLAGLFVLFILYKLFLTEGAFKRKPATLNNNRSVVVEEEVTSESDFAQLIRQAVLSGNYRLAVRYQYLQTLHKLADRNFVQLAVDKTNYQYVREINNLDYQNNFAALTLNYEYVWYGEFAIEENIYRNIEAGFNQLNSKL